MTIIKKIVSAVVIGSTALATVGSAAQAGDYYDRGYGGGYGHAPRYGHGGYGHHAPAPQPYYGGHHRRDRTGERIATGVAIGVGALILGSILANQGRRHRY